MRSFDLAIHFLQLSEGPKLSPVCQFNTSAHCDKCAIGHVYALTVGPALEVARHELMLGAGTLLLGLCSGTRCSPRVSEGGEVSGYGGDKGSVLEREGLGESRGRRR